jgi:hypothetical protein
MITQQGRSARLSSDPHLHGNQATKRGNLVVMAPQFVAANAFHHSDSFS